MMIIFRNQLKSIKTIHLLKNDLKWLSFEQALRTIEISQGTFLIAIRFESTCQ